MTDYTNARFWAISGLGYGKGFTAEEAAENYVKAQLRNFDAKNTVFKTRPKFKAALETGELEPYIWQAPEGVTGFFSDGLIHWTRGEDDHRGEEAELDQLIKRPAYDKRGN